MRRAFVVLVALVLPGAAAAQSSQFGARGVGLPGRALSARAFGAGGAFGMADPQSSLNPAAVALTDGFTATFAGLQEYRSMSNAGGSASIRSTRFPQISMVGPIRSSRFAVGLGFSNYTNRDFSVASADTLILRGIPVRVDDTLTSRGGLNLLAATLAYRLGPATNLGASFRIITGSERVEERRVFADSTFLPVSDRAEISYAGVGVAVGLTHRFGGRLLGSVTFASDGHGNIDRDSTRIGRIDLPHSVGVGLVYRAGRKLDLAAQGVYRTWSGATSDLSAGGDAENTFDVAVGGEYQPDPRRPGHRALRFGARYATLPFLFTAGKQPHELTLAAGTGLRFAQDRAGIDLAVEHARRSDGTGRSENAWHVILGVMLRP